ncbi:hypothetical protein B0J11DRAFT_532809 [Dendryphion nanum]|uniref:Uncharacterized protein n=1 Tax=Dendryphion nanum TaxID=256645 RepID=A0A9P9DKD2_9PLEO|nr:hypothetical protein B0J11DRAFT_532809 [Dendryphion nanum]
MAQQGGTFGSSANRTSAQFPNPPSAPQNPDKNPINKPTPPSINEQSRTPPSPHPSSAQLISTVPTDVIVPRSTKNTSRGARNDIEEWVLVNNPEHEPETHEGAISSHFKLDLGWGSWRTTVFRWDVDVRIKGGREERE